MTQVYVSRQATIPDPVRIRRFEKTPELGPAILFFSGGSALKHISRTLKCYTHHSIHLVTPFDSGGSSAALRHCFGMPAIGDLRSRLLALADESVTGHPEVYRLFSHRLPADLSQQQLRKRLDAIVNNQDELMRGIYNPMRRLIRNQLGYFRESMPDDFDLRGANIGNLILAGGYLNNHRHLDPIIFLFSKLVAVLGTVRAVVNDDLHLRAELADGSVLQGQHLMTGKEVAAITSPIRRLSLVESLNGDKSASCSLRKKTRRLLQQAELMVYPPGSYYTSLIANLLPDDVGKAIANNPCPKVFLPNLGHDPEQLGMTTLASVTTLLDYLRHDAGAQTPVEHLLNFILLDPAHTQLDDATRRELKGLGIQLIETNLVSDNSAPYYDPERVSHALLSLC